MTMQAHAERDWLDFNRRTNSRHGNTLHTRITKHRHPEQEASKQAGELACARSAKGDEGVGKGVNGAARSFTSITREIMAPVESAMICMTIAMLAA